MEFLSRRWLPLVLAAALTISACSNESETLPVSPSGRVPWKPPAPVNVVLILVDTLRADAVFDPEGHYDTPNIDRLVQDGVPFPRAFSMAPMTLPSHVALFSSRTPSDTKVLNNGQTVPKKLPLLAEWLGDHGYDTRAVISLGTLDPPPSGKGVTRGFDSYDADYWLMSQADNTNRRLLASLEKRDSRKPLFLFAHYSDPHEPYNAHGTETVKVELRMDGKLLDDILVSDMAFWTKDVQLSKGRTVFEFSMPGKRAGQFRVRQFECWEGEDSLELQWQDLKPMDRVKSAVIAVDRGDRKPANCQLRLWMNDVPPNDASRCSRYTQEVKFVDEYVGKLIQELQEKGLYEDSLIVFTSDHGEALGEPRSPKGRPFFGHAMDVTDEQIHVPLIVKLPRNDPRKGELQSAAKGVFSHLDLAPTVLEIVGVPPLPGQRGLSFFEPHTDVCVSQTHRPESARNQVSLRDDRYKMIFYPDAPKDERFVLYDLETDPGEITDVYAQKKAERPGWPERLARQYEHSQGDYEDGDGEEVLDAAEQKRMQDRLKALGYGGGDSEH